MINDEQLRERARRVCVATADQLREVAWTYDMWWRTEILVEAAFRGDTSEMSRQLPALGTLPLSLGPEEMAVWGILKRKAQIDA